MSTTTYKLVLVGPSWGSAATEVATAPAAWHLIDDDDNAADLPGLCSLLDTDNNAVTIKTEEDSPAERARRLLEELEKEGNSLEDALQESFVPTDSLPVFDEITSITPVADEAPAAVPLLSCLGTSVDTEALLRDLEAMLPEVTPPQSPPSEEQTVLSDIDELLFLRSLSLPDPVVYMPLTPSTLSNHSSPVASPYASPAAMSSPYHAPSTPSSQLSPYYAPSTPASQSSPMSSPYHAPSTPSSASWEDSDSTIDPDWSVEAPGPSRGRVAAARPKPYSRPAGGRARQPEDRRERKKVQNKNAATRYRQKKKAEEDELMSQEGGLAEINDKLNSKVADLSNEIRIIKGLLRDQCKRLGIIKN